MQPIVLFSGRSPAFLTEIASSYEFPLFDFARMNRPVGRKEEDDDRDNNGMVFVRLPKRCPIRKSVVEFRERRPHNAF
jgi:hypothetical protein